MSGPYLDTLKRRPEHSRGEAGSVGDLDLAVFFVKQAMQLYIEAMHYELFSGALRGHRLREFLALLAKVLEENRFSDLADDVLNFVDRYKRVLVLVKETYTMSRYGELQCRRG